MNKIYKVVWNTVRNCYVVGSELISSKSGRHSTSNGKSSSLKVTLTVLALCGMTALGSGVAPAYAADAGATTDMNQYVALKYDNSNNQNEKVEQTNGKRQTVTTFNGKRYIKVDSGVNDNTGRPIYYWVREGYSLTMVDGQPYTSLSSNGRRADVSWTGDANAKPSDILESVTSTHVQTNVTTNVGETLQQVNAGTYAGVSNSDGTEVNGKWNYIVKDSSWKGVVSNPNYRNGYADLISDNGKPRGFVRAIDEGSKLAWNATLSAYTYNGKVVDYSNIYVIDGEIGVFTNASGSEVYTGTVFGKNNEVLMTVKKSDGSYYSYWGAEVNDAGATMDTYRVAEYQKDLNVLRDNDFALYHNDIKSVDMSTNDSSATISLMRNGDGTTSPAVDGTLTLTNGGGTGGKDTYVSISNTTNGQKVSKDFSTGSKVSAIGSTDATTGLTINGVDYTIKPDVSWTAQAGGKDVNAVNQKVNFVGSDHITVTGTDGQIQFEATGLADTDFNNITNNAVTKIQNIAKGEDVHIKADTYTVGKDGSVTMTYVDGNGNPVTGEAKITGIAKSDLSNITKEGDTYITKVANKAVKVINGENTTVTPGTDGDITTYAVNVDTSGKIEQNNNNIVTGDTVYNALQNVSWKAQVDGTDAKTVAKDGTLNFVSGENINIINDNGDIKISTTGLASSGDLWTAQAGGTDVKAVNQKVNFNSTDKHLVVESTQAGEITFTTKDLADTSFTNITEEGNTYIKKLAKGEDVHIEAKEYAVNDDGSVTMTYVDGNGNTVDGTAKITGIAKSDLTNITEGGKTVINNLAKEAVKVVKGTNTTVTEGLSEDGKTKTYAVNVDNAAIQAATDVTGENGISVTSAVENGVKKYTVSAKLSNNFAIDQATGNIDLAPSIAVGKTNPVTINGNTGEITGLSNKTTTAANFADGSGRAATEEQLKEVNSKATAAKTTVTAGKNIDVKGEPDENGSTYTVALADNVSLGNNAIQLNGPDGSISAKSGGAQLAFNKNGLTVSQAKNGLTNETRIDGATITVDGGAGNQTIINGSTARIGSVLVNGGSGTATITGLTNTTTKYEGFATSGRAATEEQLKEVSGQASEAIETAGKGWNLTTNGKESSKTNIKPDGTVDFSSGNDNLVISNAGANLSFSLSDNLDLTQNDAKTGSVKVGENTALSNELLQVGKDVSLTASALNVGTSSLTTSALTVGGWTYINSSGLNANNRVISNVATGVADTDAVNVGQLNSAINGSKVSIKAGDGITVEKTGNQYTIKTNIKGGSTSTGTVTVTTEDNTSTSSGGSSKLPLRQMAIMETAEMAAAEATTTDAGKAITIANTDFDLKFKTDAGTTATVNNGGTVNISGDDVNVSTSSKAGTNSDTIRIALNKDIKVDSITAKTDGGQLNIKSEVNMNSQKITNLAEGDISETSTDAVTGSQLYNTNQAVIANAENINSLSHSLNKLDSRINRVGAGAAALAALHPLDFDPDNKWDFAAGYGNYAGANAVAIGTYYRPNENTMFSIGGSFGGGENMINAGVSFKLGSGSSGITTSKTVMAKKIKEQDELLKAQDAKMKEQDEKIAKLEALVAQQGEMIQQALGKK